MVQAFSKDWFQLQTLVRTGVPLLFVLTLYTFCNLHTKRGQQQLYDSEGGKLENGSVTTTTGKIRGAQINQLIKND